MSDGSAAIEGRWSNRTLLGRLPDPARDALLRAGTVLRSTTRPLARQGDRDEYGYLLIDGMVKLVMETAGGHRALLGVRLGGDLIGELTAMEGSVRMATVIPCSALLARSIHRTELDELMNRHPVIPMELAKLTGVQLYWANRRRVENVAYGPRMRVGSVLREIVLTHGKRYGTRWELGVPLTQAEIASLAGMKLRTVENELGKLQAEGIIERRYRRIEVVDLDALRHIANGIGDPA